MSLLTPAIAPSAMARANPVGKLAVALLISAALLLSIDWVSAAVALGLELLLLPFSGLAARDFWLRTIPLWTAAPLAGLTTVLYGQDSGATLAQFWFVSVSQGSLELGAAIALRVLAIGLPGIVLLATTDPTDLADALAQVLRLPARFVLGGLAGLRLIGLLAEDWRTLAMARRARGVADDRGILARSSRAFSQAFTLFVIAIRRGSRLATAMEAKGFGADGPRTWARPSRLHRRDLALVFVGVTIAATAVAVSIAAGSWSFVLA
ncbi:energy-coupling factor transporter transmembrane protein EcfT [Microbacteriaceae bacterium VKM Ac-2855]|nr:energy-coupling factor transporter transmembrane protein EcfT [Microbacteriaceae bacterium VKM Ac-2855]